MTEANPTPADRDGAAQGAVFDIGYQRYTGPREGRNRARLAVYKDGVRKALGFGRGGRAKALPWLFIVVLVFISLVMALTAGAAQRVLGTQPEQLNVPSHSAYYGITAFILFIFAAVVAPRLLCPDRRDGTLHLYLVRPITSTDYLEARWAAFLTVMVLVAWLPQVVLLAGLVLGHPDPGTYLGENWPDIPRFLLSGAAIGTLATTLAMFVAGFTTRRGYASVFLIGVLLVSAAFATAIIVATGREWISYFSVTGVLGGVNDLIFGNETTVEVLANNEEGVRTVQLSSSILLAAYVVWTVVPGAILWTRYRRMTA